MRTPLVWWFSRGTLACTRKGRRSFRTVPITSLRVLQQVAKSVPSMLRTSRPLKPLAYSGASATRISSALALMSHSLSCTR